MALCFHVFCTALTNGRIAWSVRHQLDWPSVVLVNRRSMLGVTNHLRLSFVVLPNGVYLFCSVPESMHSHAKMFTSLTTAFKMAFKTFDELTKVRAIKLFKRCVIGMRLFVKKTCKPRFKKGTSLEAL